MTIGIIHEGKIFTLENSSSGHCAKCAFSVPCLKQHAMANWLSTACLRVNSGNSYWKEKELSNDE